LKKLKDLSAVADWNIGKAEPRKEGPDFQGKYDLKENEGWFLIKLNVF
jgi:hypothetical protein